MIRVVVAEDRGAVRASFVVLLSAPADFEVEARPPTALTPSRSSPAPTPDVGVMDIRMPHLDGIEATRRIHAAYPGTRVRVLTTFDLDEYVHEALRAGASDFRSRMPPRTSSSPASASSPEAMRCYRRPPPRRHLPVPTNRRPRPRSSTASRTANATYCARSGLGRSNTEIAAELVVSENTVKTHVSRVFAKLGLRDRAQAVVLAYKTGVVTAGE